MMDRKQIEIPSTCNCCGEPLSVLNDQLYCVNEECSAICAKTLEHFAKIMKIKGLGPKSIEKLDLFSVIDIYSLTEEDLINVLGQANGSKVYKQIQETLTADLATVLQALSIPRVGQVTAAKLASVIHSLVDLDRNACIKAEVGNAITESILQWVGRNKDLINSLPIQFSKVKYTPNKVVCISGSIAEYKNRDELKKYLATLGYSVANNVTSKTVALICEENSNSTKVQQAIKNNIPILTLKEFIERDNNEQI